MLCSPLRSHRKTYYFIKYSNEICLKYNFVTFTIILFLLQFVYIKTNTGMPVPIAVIVCEGNIETIVHISDALDRKVPVIIIKGSGKAADLVSDYLDKYESLFNMEIEI